ncbi:MAG: glycogen debranching protein GlgX [Elusimicrobia bacterium]|nr:glycogen debranching protein GlgX [Elusimicrobiota bacterium]
MRKTSPGRFYPLGATLTPEGVNFALYSERAEGVELLLFDDPAGDPVETIPLTARQRWVWHVLVHGARAGQLYAYRVRGPFDPARGLRFNRAKALLDPYAKAFTHKPRNDGNRLLAYDPRAPDKDLSAEPADNARWLPKCIVVDDRFDWRGTPSPGHPLESLVIYEAHLKGFTAHPSSGVSKPGTYLGFIEKIPHLKALGINAVELLPVHEHYVEDFLTERGLTNYWGYNTVGFFAPESTYAAGAEPGVQVSEFKTLVRELHRAGIEVILDVVYNHTAEGSELGPTLSFRGIDNPTYYRLHGPPEAPARFYANRTGCGNEVNIGHPAVIRLVMDSLRYWADVMHVDGFRFDLASVLGRDSGEYEKSAAFFDAVSQDPVLARVKLIAEPWDLGTYQVGNFPVEWSEWNGRFRDAARRFVKGDSGMLRGIASAVCGSPDLYAEDGRTASNSINFVTCHDGFTLHDLTAYGKKHNEANREGNRDGSDENHSWNCGAEGPTPDPEVAALRLRLAKNHLCLLLFSSGTPMLLGGDEFLRTQRGNNNAYCQDNDLSWFDWRLAERNADFTEFVRKSIALTRRFAILRHRRFRHGEIEWFGPSGLPPAWDDGEGRCLAFRLEGPLFFILNADWKPHAVRLPKLGEGKAWRRIVDTWLPSPEDFLEKGREAALPDPAAYLAQPRSTIVLLGD